jgi:hypothetical protein
VAALPKYEYMVLTETTIAGWGGGMGNPLALEGVLNNLAQEGWRVITCTVTGQVKQFLDLDKSHIFVLLERPRPAAAEN